MSSTKTQAIIIRHTSFSENSVILKCFTREHGMVSFMANSIKSKSAIVKPSMLIPLTLAELDYAYQANKNLLRIKEIKATPPIFSLHTDMVKMSVAQYIAELIYRLIKDEFHKDENLFDLLFTHIQLLDLMETVDVANFPAYITCQVCAMMGYSPKGSFSLLSNSLNLRDGLFELYDERSPYHIRQELSKYLCDFFSMNYDQCKQLPLNRQERNELISEMLRYFSFQLNTNFDLQSHKILSELYQD
jgi:DNA repair protein RecO (recombination protein O)